MEAEYMSLSVLTTELLWLRSSLHERGFNLDGPTRIMEDNQSCIKLANIGSFSVNGKHISIKYRFVHEKIREQLVTLQYCPTKEMIADIFTKSLAKINFEYFRDKLGLSWINEWEGVLTTMINIHLSNNCWIYHIFPEVSRSIIIVEDFPYLLQKDLIVSHS